MSSSSTPAVVANRGAIISIVIGVVAIAALMMAFLSSASPYVTYAEAKTTAGDSLHLAGDLVPGSIMADLRSGDTRFILKDSNGEAVRVLFTEAPPSNLSEATKIVAIGKLKGEEFVAHQLLVKCPSKYEGQS